MKMPNQMQGKPTNSFISVPIDKGTMPDWETRLGYPSLFNMFIGESGFAYSTAGLDLVADINNARAVWYTPFNRGNYIVVTRNQVLFISPAGAIKSVAFINFTNLPVQIDENLQNQVTIVDGLNAYVYDQREDNFIKLTPTQGFEFTTPCSVLVLNTFTIILDTLTGGWAISNPNNALIWPVLDVVPQIQSQLTQAISLETLNSNLYIFGTTGIERWEPTYNVNAYIFPFARDNNFRKEFGAIATNSVCRGTYRVNNADIETIYFLSSKYIPMALTEGDTQVLGDIGMSKIISQYPDINQTYCSFSTFRGNYFFRMTMPETGVSWVRNQNSNKWALEDDIIIGSSPNNEIVLTEDGLFSLSLTPSHKRRRWISERMTNYKGQQQFRNLMTGVECKMVQGLQQNIPGSNHLNDVPQNLELSISLDSQQTWTNTVAAPIGLSGDRNDITIWRLSLAAYEFTLKIEYFGDLDFTIEKVTTYIN